jgi:hypothetical protein
LTGFEAISAHNGWAMALTGLLIVLTGLTLLSIIISQLHRVIALFERKSVAAEPEPRAPEKPATPEPAADLLTDLPAAARFYQSITSELGDSFALTSVFEQLKKEGIPHPHLSIKTLRENGFLVSLGDGRFSWK